MPEALILPGYWPSLGVVVEASAFGGQIIWSHKAAPHIYPTFRDIKEIDAIKAPKPGEAGLTPLFLTQMQVMRYKLNREKRFTNAWARYCWIWVISPKHS